MVKLMGTWKIIMIASVLCLLIISSLNCGLGSEQTQALEGQVVSVERGDLKMEITATGNLALSQKEDLAFELPGYVEDILVEEGEFVEEGQILAKIDTSDWEDQLTALENQVIAAERQLTTEQRDLLQTEINLKKAEIALEDAEALYIWPEEIFAARQAVWNAEEELEDARAVLRGEKLEYDRQTGQYSYRQAITPQDIDYWTRKVADAEEELRAARATLDALLAASAGDTLEVLQKRLEVELAQVRVEDAQIAIEDAQRTLAEAQEALDEAKSESPVVTATFTGFITKVNVEGGDEVFKGTVAVQLADPNKFEAEVMASEMDIFKVKLGGDASVEVTALPGSSFPAKVTHIAPTATIQSGVVNYKVKVELQSTELMVQEQSEVKQETEPEFSAEQLTKQVNERLRKAVEEGQITQEQAEQVKEYMAQLEEAIKSGRITQEQLEEIRKRMQEGQEGQAAAQQPQATAIIPEDFQLREGLSVTISIVVAHRENVLIVPNNVIIRQADGTYVEVRKEGVVEQRPIKTGLSTWRHTEVIEGLSEGEEVLVPGTYGVVEETKKPFIPGR